MSKPKVIRIRWTADAPPLPLGCRWCGHPPYAHDAASLPHRRHHQWEQPTRAQVHARMGLRRRLGLCGIFPAAVPVRPLTVHPPAGARLGRHARPVPAHGRAPDTRPATGRREPYRREAAA